MSGRVENNSVIKLLIDVNIDTDDVEAIYVNCWRNYTRFRTLYQILDEVDQLEDPSLIYNLHSPPQFGIICITNKDEELFSRVTNRLVGRLRSSEHVRIDKYHDEQLYGILSARAKWGLYEEVDEPRTKWMVRTYLSKMEQYNLLEVEGTSRVREYSLIDSAAASPMQ